MTSRPGAPIELDRCSACGGTWFDAGELLDWLKQQAPKRRFRLSLGRGGGLVADLCPRCDGRRLRERSIHGVTVRVCTRCEGVFLPSGQEPLISQRMGAKRSFYDSPTWTVIEVVGQLFLEAGS